MISGPGVFAGAGYCSPMPIVLLLIGPTPAAPPRSEDVVAGWTGLAVVLVFAAMVVCIGLLLRRNLRRLDESDLPSKWDDEPTAEDQTFEDPTFGHRR